MTEPLIIKSNTGTISSDDIITIYLVVPNTIEKVHEISLICEDFSYISKKS